MYEEHANHLNELEYGMDDDITVATDNTTSDTETEIEEQTPANRRHAPMGTNFRQAWQQILQANNIHNHPNAEQMLNTTKIQRAVEWAISDSGATGHFIVEGAPIVNKRIAQFPIAIKLPDGKIIRSTHTGNLDIPWLPHGMTECHIVPGLAHSSLISTRKFCDAGCKVSFDEDECRVYYKGQLVLTGDRDPCTTLWRLPLNPRSPQNETTLHAHLDLKMTDRQMAQHAAHNVYTLPYRRNQLKYMHQTLFNPPMETLIKAIENEQLEGFPFMKTKMVRKYLAPSPATAKGRMKRPRAGIRSTRKNVEPETNTDVTEEV